MMDLNRLKKLSEKNYNCSQKVLAYFANDLGIDENLAVKIATPFEMGMYNSEKCGALVAAYMVLGLKYGSTDFEARMNLAGKVFELDKVFEEKMSTKNCRELLGMKVLEADNMNKAAEAGLFETICDKSVAVVIEALEKMI